MVYIGARHLDTMRAKALESAKSRMGGDKSRMQQYKISDDPDVQTYLKQFSGRTRETQQRQIERQWYESSKYAHETRHYKSGTPLGQEQPKPEPKVKTKVSEVTYEL